MLTSKKVLTLLSLLIVMGVFASCKSHEKCPAYGKAPAKQSTEKSSSEASVKKLSRVTSVNERHLLFYIRV
jgi:hypothetical protein